MALLLNEELIDEGLYIGQESPDGTSEYESKVVDWYNWGFRKVIVGGGEFLPDSNPEWWWLRKQGSLILQPIIDAGTVEVTNNTTTVDFSITPTSAVDRHLKVEGHPDVFRVISPRTKATEFTIDTIYTGPTNAAASYRLMQLDYDLASDCDRLFSRMYEYRNNVRHRPGIAGVDLYRMWEEYPIEQASQGTPVLFAPLTDTSVRFSHYGGSEADDFRRVEYRYLFQPSDLADDANEPIIPRRHRSVLSELLGFRILRDKGNNLDRIISQIQASLRAMEQENNDRLSDIDDNYGRVVTRQRDRDRFLRPLRTESGSIIG